MTKHFVAQTKVLKKMILHLTAMVEDNLRNAVQSVTTGDSELAAKVVATEEKIDRYEVEVEEECLKTLALYQPVAIDLRFIVAVLKINNDLERISDLATNIAQRTGDLIKHRSVGVPFDLDGMLVKTTAMVKGSADALVARDSVLAWKVCEDDDEVDRIHHDAYIKVQDEICARPDLVDYYVNLLSVSRNLERIADHATNIAEDVIYMVEGEIVRHSGGKPD
ncbi:MAG: phosphate transport system regulatory protein PhoU [Candidatus Zixiibacteriota bacterium]|nr:MAG: phosphate transport system regulatory protein PhoU [candidate division Zixibacteria bacterium]